MEWSRSYSASWRIFRVDPDTWEDGEKVNGIDSASVTRTADGSLLESGMLEITGEIDTGYYRIVMTAEQGGDVQRVDVATLLFDVKSGTYDYGVAVHPVDGFSVLYPASTKAITIGAYAPAGSDGARYCGDLLESAINAPVQVEGSFVLNEAIVHEIGASVLGAVWSVLDAGGFVMQIDGRGIVHIMPKPSVPSLIIDSRSARLLTNGINYVNDVGSIPNRYIVIEGNKVITAVNNNIASPVSTVNRGYCVDIVENSPKAVNGETLEAYADRRLHEESFMKDERRYTREYAPGVFLYSLVRASIPGLEGDLRITEQGISCGHGITINETAVREVNLWTM